MELKKPLPKNRTYDQVKNHYEIEKSIALKLKNSSREERKLIYSTMYDELFSQVPDHPRLTRRQDHADTSSINITKFALVKNYISKQCVFAEYAPGDCNFSLEMSKHVSQVVGIDISDQRGDWQETPENFDLIIYDGYNLDKISDNSLDVIFSDQLIEHFHPDDTELHFSLVHSKLKSGGAYIFRTPHVLRGPFDVSQYFSDSAECFHLKEWSYTGIYDLLLRQLNYRKLRTYWNIRSINIRLPYLFFFASEKLLQFLPRKISRALAKYITPNICCAAIKN